MARRYLNISDIRSTLNRGKTVEQYLGSAQTTNGWVIRYVVLTLRTNQEEIYVRYYVAADIGNEQYIDIYEFPEADPSLEQGEAQEENILANLEEALRYAQKRYGALKEKYVNAGVTQDEYRDDLQARNRTSTQ